MDSNGQYKLTGGNRLYGEVTISGAKNSAVAIIAATTAVDGECRIEHVPEVSDIETLNRILAEIGVVINRTETDTYQYRSNEVDPDVSAPQALYGQFRASYYLLGAMLGRFGYAQVALPGGCDFGDRPIGLHIKGFEALGAKLDTNGGWITAKAESGKLRGARIYLDFPSVGATINIMLAAVHADGMTIIENAAMEPNVVDLANFLNAMGAQIGGAGTKLIRIRGVDRLTGGEYTIQPDQIEAGTYLTMVAATGGDVIVRDVIPHHLSSIMAKLSEANVELENLGDAVRVRRIGRPLWRTNVRTDVYPAFPTDMQPQMTTLLSIARGTSYVTETVFDNRFRYISELKKMGAKITIQGMTTACIEGVGKLYAAPVSAVDLRAGAAMMIAGLCAEGETVISDIHHIERGYENIVSKLEDIGAEIEYEPPAREKLIRFVTTSEDDHIA